MDGFVWGILLISKQMCRVIFIIQCFQFECFDMLYQPRKADTSTYLFSCLTTESALLKESVQPKKCQWLESFCFPFPKNASSTVALSKKRTFIGNVVGLHDLHASWEGLRLIHHRAPSQGTSN